MDNATKIQWDIRREGRPEAYSKGKNLMLPQAISTVKQYGCHHRTMDKHRRVRYNDIFAS